MTEEEQEKAQGYWADFLCDLHHAEPGSQGMLVHVSKDMWINEMERRENDGE